MPAPAKRTEILRFLRFVVSGGLNTLVSYVVFLAASLVFHYAVAYTMAYIAGILLSYWLAATFVFGTGFAARSALRFPLVYIVQYLYGVGVLFVMVDLLGISHHVAMLLAIITSIPLSFVLVRYVMRPRCEAHVTINRA
jgi:putative flippase GtrA